jgi:peptide/nickel transport system substrate-binding protein
MHTKPRELRCVAIVSLIVASALTANARPRYGGTLRIQLTSVSNALRQSALTHLTSETLTRLNASGVPEPLLALSWSSDRNTRRWRFRLRSSVVTHEGSPLTPADAAKHLENSLKHSGLEVAATTDGLIITAAAPRPDLPAVLAGAAFGIAGTGPFVPAGDNVLNAFENHWAGRPFVDHIELLPPRAGALVASSAEVWEIPVGPGRRGIPEGLNIWSTAPIELLAVELIEPNPAVAAALSASIDRDSIATALTQRRGEPAASLLPEWLTGYSFLFSTRRDLARVKSLLAKVQPVKFMLSYDTSDPLARIVAERVALNARDAGLSIQVRGDLAPQLRIIRWILSPNAALALDQLGQRPESSEPEAMHAAERVLLGQGRLVPIMHLPLVFGFSPRVQLPVGRERILPRLPFADSWLSP